MICTIDLEMLAVILTHMGYYQLSLLLEIKDGGEHQIYRKQHVNDINQEITRVNFQLYLHLYGELCFV